MNCDQVLQQMWRYLDGDLDGATSGDLERHLGRCRRCFSRIEFEKQLTAMVKRSCESEHVPPHLQERVRKILRLF
jgi:mycothiol system anti-sigma-R factor